MLPKLICKANELIDWCNQRAAIFTQLGFLQDQITDLQNQINNLPPDTDTDDQQLSLVGNTLTLEDGGSVDLTQYLDDTNTDEQVLAVSLQGTDLVLSISNGNTQTVPLSAIDTDDQTLQFLTDNTLTISDGNTVDLSSLEESPVFSTVYVEQFAGGTNNGVASGAWARNSTVVRDDEGEWTVTFASAHPDGEDYEISFGQGESEANNARDVPKVSWVDGTKTANGFRVQVTVDDNGAGADARSDDAWSYSVSAPRQVVTGLV